jgi:hypothetical protein
MSSYTLHFIIVLILIIVTIIYYYSYTENFENNKNLSIPQELEILEYNNQITNLSNLISNNPTENLLLKASQLSAQNKLNFDNISNLNENIINSGFNNDSNSSLDIINSLKSNEINDLFIKIKGNVNTLYNFNEIKKFDIDNQTLI